MVRQIVASASVVMAVGLLVLACKPGGVGDPCIPNEEFNEEYSGASESGFAVEDRSFQCETRLCLVNHFRGRVTCPFGNEEGREYNNGKFNGDKEDIKKCWVPGTNKSVTKPVPAQCKERKDQVYCSCRCGGTDTSAKYCECPSGYVCASLDPTGTEESKYCVKKEDTKTTGSGSNEKIVVVPKPCSEGCHEAEDLCGFKSNVYEY